LTGLRQLALQDIAAGTLTGIDAFLRNAILPKLAWVVAGFAQLHYGFLDWCFRQATPFTATAEFLEAWAALKGVVREPATFATGTASFVASNNVPVPAGTSITRSDNFAYVSTAPGTASGNTVLVPIIATTSGAAGNAGAGVTLTLSTPIAGINSTGTAAGAIVNGADAELDQSLRQRMLAAYQAPPHGGARADYPQWARAVPGVSRAWVTPLGMGAGTVVVYIMLDLAEAAFGGFPQGTNGVAANDVRGPAATGDQLTVANAIYQVQPVQALVYLVAPAPQPIPFTIANLGANNTPAMQAAIQAALTDMFLRLGNVGGSVNPATGGAWGTIDESDWNAGISAIPGMGQFTVTAPVAPIVASVGSLPVLGPCSFSA
jgi:uncharacterized phage protein gp47/JayE